MEYKEMLQGTGRLCNKMRGERENKMIKAWHSINYEAMIPKE
jgi:hypothetical protein